MTKAGVANIVMDTYIVQMGTISSGIRKDPSKHRGISIMLSKIANKIVS